MRYRSSFLVPLVAVSLALSSCSGGEAPAASPTPSRSSVGGSSGEPASPSPSATPTSAPSPADVTVIIPTCDELLSTAQVQAILSDTRVQPYDVDPSFTPQLPGPLARAALAEATSARSCAWGIPQSDAGFLVTVVVIPRSASDDLVAALRTSVEYAHSASRGVERFSIEITNDIGTTLGYAFDGTVWAIADGTMLGPDTAVEIAQAAVEATRATGG